MAGAWAAAFESTSFLVSPPGERTFVICCEGRFVRSLQLENFSAVRIGYFTYGVIHGLGQGFVRTGILVDFRWPAALLSPPVSVRTLAQSLRWGNYREKQIDSASNAPQHKILLFVHNFFMFVGR